MGDSAAADGRAEQPFALDVIRSWPASTHAAAYAVLLVHGAPDEASERRLRWEPLRSWTRVVVSADDEEAPVESVLTVRRPVEPTPDAIAVARDFGVTFEDDGDIAVRGVSLQANAVTLNVLDALLGGEISADEARERRATQLADVHKGRTPADAEHLRLADDAPHGEPRTVRPRRRRGAAPSADALE